jgi:hypothetical protein
LSIIGEGLSKANKIDALINITNIRKIILFRYISIHDQDKIGMPPVWLKKTKNYIVLRDEIEITLKKRDGSSIN